ncbi:Crp/Fnr family transcriptional regulator [Caulobacter zeae]|uniref:Crp/Fnr family transcriptional regulator n=1 Tax=Caulobacter zeae TaxID=2055137 RepID=A0A2N5DRE4_9CAUL|nr:helix-turn-helix domain-containing protein [Caulobacter zeae]PLR28627.1 Crp/Fnr family transcriptional regulator [Caulobacter zeae]
MVSTAILHPAISAPPIETGLTSLFEQLGVVTAFRPEEEVCAQDEANDVVYLVLSGAVRSARLLSDGRRQISGFYYAGDVLGLATSLFHQPAVEALVDTRTIAVRRSALPHFGLPGERLERLLWRATSEELARVHDHMMLLARKSAVERVAGFLEDIAQRAGGDWVFLPMPRQDIADYLGLSIETVSRMLTQLQGQRLVAFDGCRRFRICASARLARLLAA